MANRRFAHCQRRRTLVSLSAFDKHEILINCFFEAFTYELTFLLAGFSKRHRFTK